MPAPPRKGLMRGPDAICGCVQVWICVQTIIRSFPAIPDGFEVSGFSGKGVLLTCSPQHHSCLRATRLCGI